MANTNIFNRKVRFVSSERQGIESSILRSHFLHNTAVSLTPTLLRLVTGVRLSLRIFVFYIYAIDDDLYLLGFCHMDWLRVTDDFTDIGLLFEGQAVRKSGL
jgi:hypothetical protein